MGCNKTRRQHDFTCSLSFLWGGDLKIQKKTTKCPIVGGFHHKVSDVKGKDTRLGSRLHADGKTVNNVHVGGPRSLSAGYHCHLQMSGESSEQTALQWGEWKRARCLDTRQRNEPSASR